MTTITPRDYQIPAIDATVKALTEQNRALVVMATSLGKTIVSALAAKIINAKKILFLVHINSILTQTKDEYERVFGNTKTYAFYNGNSKDGAEFTDVVFASFPSMHKNLLKWKKDHFDLIVVDEAHHSQAFTYKEVITYFKAKRLSLTATPNRNDTEDIRELFGEEVVNIPLEEGIARGQLPPIEYHIKVDEGLDNDVLNTIMQEVEHEGKRITIAELNRRVFIKTRDDEIATIIKETKLSSIVFCQSIPHADHMLTCFGKDARVYHSDMSDDENEKALTALKNSEIRTILAVNSFNEGLDVPDVGLVAFCRTTSSENIFLQQLGRGLHTGMDKLIVFDFVGNIERVLMLQKISNTIADFHEANTSKEDREKEGYEHNKLHLVGKGFTFTFSDRVVNLLHILERGQMDLYPTLTEASEAARKLGIRTQLEYNKRRREDSRLPSRPERSYPDFPNWYEFLGKKKPEFYATWQEAGEAARRLGIKSQPEYIKNYSKDPKLPSTPKVFYSDFPGLSIFLDTKYHTWKEASEAARRLGIKSRPQYKKKRIEDIKLPADPHTFYPDFPNWYEFLGKKKPEFYATWQEAGEAARRLGIKSQPEYIKNYSKDPKLPSSLYIYYSDFPGINAFLDTTKYSTWKEASEVVKKLAIKTQDEYKKRYSEDPKLPSAPHDFYPDFPNWYEFLGKKKPEFYATWQEAGEAARRLGIRTQREYNKRSNEDPRLPGGPHNFYSDFPGLNKFLGKE